MRHFVQARGMPLHQPESPALLRRRRQAPKRFLHDNSPLLHVKRLAETRFLRAFICAKAAAASDRSFDPLPDSACRSRGRNFARRSSARPDGRESSSSKWPQADRAHRPANDRGTLAHLAADARAGDIVLFTSWKEFRGKALDIAQAGTDLRLDASSKHSQFHIKRDVSLAPPESAQAGMSRDNCSGSI